MHTKDKLAGALRAAGLEAMARKAAEGCYHDFLSPLAMPSQQLAHDLKGYATAPSWPRKDEAQALLKQHMEGAFDASEEESDAWANSPEGRETFAKLSSDARTARGEMPPEAAAKAAAKPHGGTMPMRLAFRAEGQFWVAYLAKPDDMGDAIPLGSILLNAARQGSPHRTAFMNLMLASEAIKHATGSAVDFSGAVAKRAPEHERTRQ